MSAQYLICLHFIPFDRMRHPLNLPRSLLPLLFLRPQRGRNVNALNRLPNHQRLALPQRPLLYPTPLPLLLSKRPLRPPPRRRNVKSPSLNLSLRPREHSSRSLLHPNRNLPLLLPRLLLDPSDRKPNLRANPHLPSKRRLLQQLNPNRKVPLDDKNHKNRLS